MWIIQHYKFEATFALMSPRALVLLMLCLLAVSPRLLRNEHLQQPVTAP